MNYLKDGRNSMTTRIAQTVGKYWYQITGNLEILSEVFHSMLFCKIFLKVLVEGEKYGESKRLKIASLEKIVNEGRYVAMLH